MVFERGVMKSAKGSWIGSCQSADDNEKLECEVISEKRPGKLPAMSPAHVKLETRGREVQGG
jgi:hypothetical protein